MRYLKWQIPALLFLLVLLGIAGYLVLTRWDTSPEGYAYFFSSSDLDIPIPSPTVTPNATMLEQTIRSADASAYPIITEHVLERTDLPTAQRVALLLQLLERVSTAPSALPVVPTSYLAPTSISKWQIARALGDLGGDARTPLIHAIPTLVGEQRGWAITGLGYTGSPDAVPLLRELLTSSRQGDIRATAAYQLGVLKAHEAIPELRRALTDTYHVSTGGEQASILYPVREQAAGALVELGVKVERTGDGSYRIVQE